MEKAPFSNTYPRSLDAKGRLMLPPEYRDAILGASGGGEAGLFWLTSFHGKLTAYLPGEWSAITAALQRIPFSSERLSHFKSRVLGLAQALTPDAQGRVRIPQPLVRAGGLKKDVLLVGMDTKFEIWDQDRFDALQDADIFEELTKCGLTLPM